MQLSNLRGFMTGVAIVAMCALAVRYAMHVPSIVPASAPATQFSAERAMQQVRAIAQRPHPIGSEESRRVGQYVLQTLISMGVMTTIQEQTAVGTRDPVAGRVHNIIGRLQGLNADAPVVLLVAHYDGVAAGPAASDDGSGTAVLLETMRALVAGGPLRNDVVALFTDGEEVGLLGAAGFVRSHRLPIGVVLNFEARGTHGPSLMFETGPGNLDVVRMLRRVGGVRATSLSTTVYRKLPNDTDLSEFAVLGVPAMNFAFIGGVNRYHTAEDDVAHLDARSLQAHGNQALRLARAFANDRLPRPRTSDAVFFDLPVLGLVLYPQSWALPIALLGLVLVIVAIARLRKRDPAWLADVGFGAIGLVLSLIAAALMAFVMTRVLRVVHLALPGGGSPAWSGIYAIALALFAVATAAAIYTAVRRRRGAAGSYLGALLVWALLAALVSVSSPGASFVFTWPLLVAGAVAAVGIGSSRAALDTTLLWVATIIALLFLVPTVYLMVCSALGLDEPGAIILAIFAVLGTWLLAPHLESMRGTGRRGTPIVAAVLALLLVVVGLFTVRNNAASPAGGSLVYAVDADSGTAWLTGSASTPYSGKWLDRALRRADTTRQPPNWLTRTYGSRRVVAAPMATGPQAAPEVTILSDTSASGTRTVTLQVRAAPGTLGVSIASNGGPILSATVDGVPVDTSRYRFKPSRWTLFYAAPPMTGYTVALTMPAFAHPALDVAARFSGIPALSGFQLPMRPQGIIPFQWGDITLVYKRVPL